MKSAATKPSTRNNSKACLSEKVRDGRIMARVPVRIRARRKETAEVDARDYRVPMEVTQILKLAENNCYPVCPRCKITVEREYMRFCDRCGQRLGWRKLTNAVIVYPGFNRK